MYRSTILTALLLFTGAALAAAEPLYPANPAVTADAYFVSGQGLTRFARDGGGKEWRALPGERVHEPVVGRELVLVAGAGGLFAVDRQSGVTRWQRRFGSEAFSPVVEEGRAYLATQAGELHALDVTSGRSLWRRKLGDGWIYPPAMVGDLLVTGGQDAMVWAVDSNTGAIRWQTEIDQELVYSPVAAGDQRLLLTTFNGDLIALDSSDGRELWRSRFAAASLMPSVIDGRILLPGMDGVLRAVAPTDGALLWQQQLDGPPAPPLVARDGRLLATTQEGSYFMLQADSGEILQQQGVQGDLVGAALLSAEQALIFVNSRNKTEPTPVLVSVMKD